MACRLHAKTFVLSCCPSAYQSDLPYSTDGRNARILKKSEGSTAGLLPAKLGILGNRIEGKSKQNSVGWRDVLVERVAPDPRQSEGAAFVSIGQVGRRAARFIENKVTARAS